MGKAMQRNHSDGTHILIDPDGEFVGVDSGKIMSRIGRKISHAAVIQYMVTNLGWIEFSHNQRGMRLRCRPSIVSDAAVTTILFQLADNPDCPLALSVLGGEWRHIIHVCHRDAITLIESMRTENTGEQVLLRLRRPPDASPHSRNAHAVQEYCRHPKSMADLVAFCSRLYAGERWSLSHFDGVHGPLVMDFVSEGYTPFNSGWVSRYRSSTLDAYAGREYAAWVAETRALAIASNDTIYDDVDATVAFPGIGLSRLRYARASIPIRLACGAMYVVSSAVTDLSIRLKETG
jgi:hypothetical protein